MSKPASRETRGDRRQGGEIEERSTAEGLPVHVCMSWSSVLEAGLTEALQRVRTKREERIKQQHQEVRTTHTHGLRA